MYMGEEVVLPPSVSTLLTEQDQTEPRASQLALEMPAISNCGVQGLDLLPFTRVLGILVLGWKYFTC